LPIDIQETRLPGIGTRFSMRLASGRRFVVIVHTDGRRELYTFRTAHSEDPQDVIVLDDDEARQLAALIGGAYERPKIIEDLELALEELQIEWIHVPDDSPTIGKTLAECAFRANTGITVIAILREPEPITGAQPDDVIESGDTLVTVGKAGQYPAFRRLLVKGQPASK
jgi:TrkA domain protein